MQWAITGCLCASIAIAGCSTEENEGPNGASVPLGIEMSLSGEYSGSTPFTRGTINTDGAQIGVFLTGEEYPPLFDKKYKYSTATSAWSAGNETIYLDNRVGKVTVYYDPNNLNPLTNPTNSTLATLTAKLYKDSEMWYYDDTQLPVSSANSAIAFKMKPAYARVMLNIARDYRYTAGLCAIGNIVFSSNGTFYENGTLDISNSTIVGSTVASFNIDLGITEIAAGTTNTACDLLLPPQPISTVVDQGLTIALTVDGAPRTITIPASYFAGNKLSAGTAYTIELLITKSEIAMLDVATFENNSWGALPSTANGYVEEAVP